MNIKNRIFSVRIAISGRDIMRCINVLARRNVAVSHLEWKENTVLHCNISSQLLWQNRDVFHKTHCKVRIIKKNVWNQKLHKHVFRSISVLWAIMLVITLYYSYQFIWKINIEGNQYYSKEYVQKELNKMGITEGTLKRAISEKDAATQIRNSIPGIRWVSIGIQGTRLLVRMEEAPDELQKTISSDKAEWDWEELTQLKQHPRRDYCFEKAYVIKEKRLRSHSQKRETAIQIGDYIFSIDFPWNVSNKKKRTMAITEYQRKQISLGNQFYIPVYLWDNTVHYLEEEWNCRSKRDVVNLANYDFAYFLSNLEENGVHIIDKNVIMEQDENSYIVKGRVTGEPDLAMRLKEGYRK